MGGIAATIEHAINRDGVINRRIEDRDGMYEAWFFTKVYIHLHYPAPIIRLSTTYARALRIAYYKEHYPSYSSRWSLLETRACSDLICNGIMVEISKPHTTRRRSSAPSVIAADRVSTPVGGQLFRRSPLTSAVRQRRAAVVNDNLRCWTDATFCSPRPSPSSTRAYYAWDYSPAPPKKSPT